LSNYTRDPPKELSLPLRLPLVGIPNQRATAAEKDSRLVNAYVEFGQDEVLRIIKRPGLTVLNNNGGYGGGLYQDFSVFYTAVEGGWQSKIYQGSTFVVSIGSYTASTATPPDRFFYFNLVQTGIGTSALLFHDQYTIWTYSTADGLEVLPYQGDTVVGPDSYNLTLDSTTIIKAAPSTSGLLRYSEVSGTGIPDGTLIESIDSDLNLTISAPATATGLSALTFTLSGPVKRTGVGTLLQLAGGVESLNTSSYLFTHHRQIIGSDPLDPRAWDPLNVIYAYANLDSPEHIGKNLSYLVAFKGSSVEFFRDVGTSPGSPLERLEGLKLAVGCWTGRTVADIDGALLWCSYTESGMKSVYYMANLKAEEIASPAVRRMLEEIDPKYAIAFSISGHSFYVLTDPGAGISLVYDITSKVWGYWNALGVSYFPFVAASVIAGEGGIRLQHESDGKVYFMSPSSILDDGAPIVMDIYPPLFDANMRQAKYLARMYVNADQEPGSILKLRVNDDDQTTDEWTEYREIDLSHPRPALYDCGSFTKRNFHFRHESATPCRLVSVELDLLPGTL
jgi:hypothetical protein